MIIFIIRYLRISRLSLEINKKKSFKNKNKTIKLKMIKLKMNKMIKISKFRSI